MNLKSRMSFSFQIQVFWALQKKVQLKKENCFIYKVPNFVLSLISSLKMSNRVKDCLLRTGEGDLGGDRKIIIL